VIDNIKIEGLPLDDEEWLVKEYGGIKWNASVSDEPLVNVLLENVNTGEFSDSDVAKSYTKLLEKGSIWKNGEYVREQKGLIEKVFRFSFGADDKNLFTGAWDRDKEDELPDETLEKNRKRYVLPPHVYKVPKSFSEARFFTVKTDCGVELLTNSLTVFDKTYGVSGFLQQVVLSHYASLAIKKLEFTEFEEKDFSNERKENECILGLAKNVLDSDRYFVYSLKHSEYTVKTVNYIATQLNKNRKSSTFLRVRPWSSGYHQWKVSGIWLVPEKRFLALKIKKYLLPKFSNFFLVRENSNIVSENGNEAEKRCSGKNRNASKNVTGTSKSRPASDSIGEDIPIIGTENWGETDVRKAIPKENKSKRQYNDRKPVHREKVSPSSHTGSNPDVGKINLRDALEDHDPVKNSPNTINLLWSALRKLAYDKASEVSPPASLTPTNEQYEFVAGRLCLIEPENNDAWCFRKEHRKHRRRRYQSLPKRKFGTFHLVFQGSHFFFVCIERFSSEKFRTCIFSFDSESEFLDVLPTVLSDIVAAKGVWKKASRAMSRGVTQITHRGEKNEIAGQIARKLELLTENKAK